MKIGHVILVLSGLLVLGASITTFVGRSDAPTKLTNANALTELTFGNTLSALATPADQPDEDAGGYYERAVELYQANREALPKTRAYDDMVEQVCEQLLLASAAGRVADGFMDSHIPTEIGAGPDFDDALEQVFSVALYRAAYLYTHDDPDAARDLTLAVWVLGRRMFEHNLRLYNRNTGLDMMESSGSMLFEMSATDEGLDGNAIREWSVAIGQIRRHWQPKLEILLGVDPPIGDLVNIAKHDGDRMFRVEGTLRLGIHKHGSIGRGNRRAIERAIRQALQSDDPVLAEAARAADALTLKEKRRLY